MQYRVRFLRTGESAVDEQWVESRSETLLRAAFQAQGQIVLSVRAAPKNWLTRQRLLKPRYPLFCREIRTLIRAGMTVVEAVETIAARERVEGHGDGLSVALLDKLQQGLSLSVALNEMTEAPSVLIAAVQAGERTSNLAESLDDYLRFDGMVDQLRKKILNAAIYPALVTVLGVAISLFLLLVVVPAFSGMYANLRGSATGAMGLTIQISEFIAIHRADVLVGTVLATIALIAWIAGGGARRLCLQVCQTIPWVRRRVQDFQLAMVYQALALLLKGGYPMTQALQIAAQSALSLPLREALVQAHRQIEQGGAVSQALAAAELCDEVGRRLMFAAERNGDFFLVTDVVSRIHGERFELFVERVSRIAEPLLLLGVALLVGGIVIMMYLPVFNMGAQLR